MIYDAKDCLMANTKLRWKELFYICEIEKYKLIHLTSFYTNLINIPAEEYT